MTTTTSSSSSQQTDAATELISELKTMMTTRNSLTPIDDKKIKSITDSINDAHYHMMAIKSNPYAQITHPYYASSIEYHKATYLHKKRCLLSYLLWRLTKINNSWWSTDDNLIRPLLSNAEAEYLEEYNQIMVEYMNSFTNPLNLRCAQWRPPFKQQLEVRGMTSYTFLSNVTNLPVNIYPGKQILVSFEEAELLLSQKVVELILKEEKKEQEQDHYVICESNLTA